MPLGSVQDISDRDGQLRGGAGYARGKQVARVGAATFGLSRAQAAPQRRGIALYVLLTVVASARIASDRLDNSGG